MSKRFFLSRVNRVNRIIVLSFVLVLGLAGFSIAQGYQPGQGQNPEEQQQQYMPPGQEGQQAAPDFSDAELQKTAEAYVSVMEIREKYQDQLAEAKDPNKAQEIQTKANEEITGAIKNKGLELTRYNDVISAAQTNEKVRTDLLEKINEIKE
ncbi:MAG: DUF4168 domain-containing protein [Desulfobacterales bacterium]